MLEWLLRMCIVSICLLRLLRKLVMRTSYWACAAAGFEYLLQKTVEEHESQDSEKEHL